MFSRAEAPSSPGSSLELGFELESGPEPEPEQRSPPSPTDADVESGPVRTDGLPTSETTAGRLNFARQKKTGLWVAEGPVRLRNSLLLGVGFLEIANAGDFAANVFNQDPPPAFAIALMVLGGLLALSMLYFVVKDATLSLENLGGLRAERRYLRAQQAAHARDSAMLRTIECLLDVNARESGTELIDRIGMDVFMGMGALVVGVGTLLATGGSQRRIFEASNLLTGYIGNTPCAIYGLTNLLWSTWVWRRATRHRRAVASARSVRGTRIEQLVKMRTSSVQFHAALNGLSGAVAGVASLVTATMWWGYVVLVPCLVTSVLVNVFWRTRVGYDRPFVRDLVPLDPECLLEALRYVDRCLHLTRSLGTGDSALAVLAYEPGSLPSAIEVVTDSQLLEYYSLRLLHDAELSAALFPAAGDRVTVRPRELARTADPALAARLVHLADDVVRDRVPRCFRDQERYLLETLGCYMCTVPGGRGKSRDVRPPDAQRNANSYSGRHANDWLFGGFSFRDLVRQSFVPE